MIRTIAAAAIAAGLLIPTAASAATTPDRCQASTSCGTQQSTGSATSATQALKISVGPVATGRVLKVTANGGPVVTVVAPSALLPSEQFTFVAP